MIPAAAASRAAIVRRFGAPVRNAARYGADADARRASQTVKRETPE